MALLSRDERLVRISKFRRERLALVLGAALLAVKWTAQDLNREAARFFGRPHRRAKRRLIRELMQSLPGAYPPSPGWLLDWLLSSEHFASLCSGLPLAQPTPSVTLASAAFAPLPALSELDIPQLRTAGDLADWLYITPGELDWFADSRHQHARCAIPILQHYSYAFVARRSGFPRLIEAPKPRLRAVQRRILHEILDLLPAHPGAHGFVRGRSCLTGAQIHAGEGVVITMDLRNFFATVALPRVHAIFRCLGYPWAVAKLLTGLCTTATPASVFARPEGQAYDHPTRKRYEMPHLAQGAPTSPALANLTAWNLDVRLAALARRFDANYTRYADDLAFSGADALAARLEHFRDMVAAIVHDEGFSLNSGKTRIMRSSARQQITGLVVNEHVNVPRRAHDELKAILHNCVRFGPQEQNRRGLDDFRAHLDGRVSWVEAVNPKRGAWLRQAFNAIRW